MPAILDGNRRRWQSNANYAEVLSLDIDGGLSIVDAMGNDKIRSCCGLGIESSSSTPELNKFRLVFPLAEPLNSNKEIRLCNVYLQFLVGSADKSCKDASRFYFGGLGRVPFLLNDHACLPPDFLQRAKDWQAENDRIRAEEQRTQALERIAKRERIVASGGESIDIPGLIRDANDRLGADAFLRYLEHEKAPGDKYKVLPGFRVGSGSYSAFISPTTNGTWRYHDPSGGHNCDGFYFFVWQKRGQGFIPKGSEFWELLREYCSGAGVEVPERKRKTPYKGFAELTEPKSKAQQQREWRAIQGEITRKAILKPFGDRPYDVICTTKEQLEQAILDNPRCFVDGPTGSGKTESFKVLLGHIVNHLGFAPLRSLARSAAAAHGQPYWNENRKGLLDSAWACIHSVLGVTSAERVYDRTYLYLDEPEQLLEALLASKLCEEDRGDKIAALRNECSTSDRIVIAGATSALKEFNYFEAISGKPFTLIRFDPQLHQKGSFTIYTAQEGVKGSNKAALNYVRSLTSLPRSYIASDSSDKAIETLIRSDIPTMLANKRTAGDDDEVKTLLSSPNPGEHWKTTGYSNLVASPLIQSGFSMKGDLFDQVFGVFTGKSISPSNCVQQLERYRSSVPRICYAPRYSAPPASIGTGRSPRGVGSFKERQAKQWELEADHLQNTVRTGAFTGFKYLAGAEREWYREWEIQRDREFRNFAVAMEAYATRQGFKVNYAVAPLDSQCESLRDEVNDWKATPIVTRGNDRPLHKAEVADLLADGKELSQEDSDRIEAYLIRDYYGLAWNAPLPKEKIIDEGFGDGRKALRKALRILWEGQAESDDQSQRNKLGDSGYIWDVSNHALTLKWWDRLGIDDVLAFCLENPYSSVSPEIRAFSDRLAESQSELGEGSKLLGIKIPWRGENTQAHYGKVVQWLGMMLKALGIENKYQRVRDDLGNVLPRVYSIVPESLERLKEAIDHKTEKQIQQGFTPRSTPLFYLLCKSVDQNALENELSQEWDRPDPDLPKIEELMAELDRLTQKFQPIAPLFDPIRETIAA